MYFTENLHLLTLLGNFSAEYTRITLSELFLQRMRETDYKRRA